MALANVAYQTLTAVNNNLKTLGASFTEIDDFTEGWEGGLTDDIDDNASKYPVPGTYTKIKKGKPHTSSRWHTNKGVTWATFKSNAVKLGYSATPELFFLMPKEIWLKIAKSRYWDILYLDQYQSQAIANILFSWQWMSGYKWRDTVQRYLKSRNIFWKVSDLKGLVTIMNALTKSNEKKLFKDFVDQKLQYLKSLNDWPKYGKGWTARLMELQSKSAKFIIENKAAVGAGGTLFLITVTGFIIALNSKKADGKRN